MTRLSSLRIESLPRVLLSAALLCASGLGDAAGAAGVAPPDSAAARRDTAATTRDTLGTVPFTLTIDRTFGRFGVNAGELSSPGGIAIDPRGAVLVADTGNHRVVRFDSTGTTLGQFGGFGYGPNQLNQPRELFVGGTLYVWVLDRGNARIVKYDVEGRLIGVVVELENTLVRNRLGLVRPEGFSADPSGKLYLSDSAGDRVIVFDPLGAVLEVRGEFGTQGGRFNDPSGVAVDTRARLLVGDSGNRRVQALDSFGGFVAALPLDTGMKGEDGLSLAFGPDGTWALADRASGRLAWYDTRGRVLARHVPQNKRDLWVGAVAFDAAGRLYASDPRAHRVVRFQARSAGP